MNKVSNINYKFLFKHLYTYWVEYIILLIVVYISYMYQLGTTNIHTWDEGVYASNVLEMLYRKNFIIKYYNGAPELWATIPPLIAWFQTLSFTLFGISEATFRIPTAMAAIVTTIFIFLFILKEFKERYWGLFSAFILALSYGYVCHHVARTGDLDVFVTMFSTLYCLFFYRFYRTGFTNNRIAFLFILFVFCSFWTKMIAGFFYLPILFLYIFTSKKHKVFFSNIKIYLYSGIFIAITIFYYAYTEYKVPGYFSIALHNTLIGRITGTLTDNHIEPFLYYWNNIKSNNFLPWLYFLPLSIFFLFFEKEKEKRNFLIFIILLIIFYWVVISCSINKLSWYDAQLYPMLAILVGYSFKKIYNWISSLLKFNTYMKWIFFIIFFTASFLSTVLGMERKNIKEKQILNNDEYYGTALKDISITYPDKKDIEILHPGFSPHVNYYLTLYNLFYNYKIKDIDITNNIPIYSNSYILFSHPEVINSLNKNYSYDVLYKKNNVIFIHVKNCITPHVSIYYLDADSLGTNYNGYSTKYSSTGQASICLNASNPYSFCWEFPTNELKYQNITKIHITADLLMENIIFDPQIVCEIQKSKFWKGYSIKDMVKSPNIWYKIDKTIYLPINERKNENVLRLYIWNNNINNLFIDNLKLELLK